MNFATEHPPCVAVIHSGKASRPTGACGYIDTQRIAVKRESPPRDPVRPPAGGEDDGRSLILAR
jgi:hypothetical protein